MVSPQAKRPVPPLAIGDIVQEPKTYKSGRSRGRERAEKKQRIRRARDSPTHTPTAPTASPSSAASTVTDVAGVDPQTPPADGSCPFLDMNNVLVQHVLKHVNILQEAPLRSL